MGVAFKNALIHKILNFIFKRNKSNSNNNRTDNSDGNNQSIDEITCWEMRTLNK